MTSINTQRLRKTNSGAAIKVACQAASTANLTLSGEQTVDGIALLEANEDRVLCKDQTDATENGIYIVSTGAWTRAPDFNGSFDVAEGTIIPVSRGTVNADSEFRVTNVGDITIGTTSLTFEVRGEGLGFTNQVSDDLTVTVGSGGNYSTINAALEALSSKYPLYQESGVSLTISLLAGFVMAEQVIVDGIDLGWITITSVDAETTITRSALTTANIAGDEYPAFTAQNGATMPTIDALFTMDTSGSATQRHGFRYLRGSRGHIKSGAGCKNAGDRGLYVSRSFVSAATTIWTGALGHCIRFSDGAHGNARGATATGGGTYNMSISSSFVDAADINCSSSAAGATANILVTQGSHARLSSCHAQSSDAIGILVAEGSMAVIDHQGADATNATVASAGSIGLNVKDASVVDARNLVATGCTGDGFRLQRGAIVSAVGADTTTAGANGAWVLDGSHFTCADATIVGTTNDLLIEDGSIVCADNMTGTPSITQNFISPTGNGIIFDSTVTTGNRGTGSIASGSTTDVIAHGLDVTPTAEDFTITGKENPTNSVGTVWIDTIDATNFTVNVENDPGASNWDFGWRVQTN